MPQVPGRITRWRGLLPYTILYGIRTVAALFAFFLDALAQNCWPEPEFEDSVNDDELGNLRLTGEQEDAIVEFLKTLSDGYF